MKKILIVLTTVLLAALAACDNERDTGTSHGTAPLNQISITRAGGAAQVTIDDGSELELYIKDATDTRKYALYEYVGGKWIADPDESDEIICGTGSYPAYGYGEIDITHPSTNFKETISVTWVGPLTTTVVSGVPVATPLEMSIATARIKVTIIGAYGEADASLPNFRIVSAAGSKHSWISPTDPYTEPHTIKAYDDNFEAWDYRTNAGYSEGNTPPQTIAAGNVLFAITATTGTHPNYGSNKYIVIAPADIELKAGKEYHYTIRLGGGGQAEIITEDIADFTPGGSSEINSYRGIKTEADLRQFSTDWNTNCHAARSKWEDVPNSGVIRLLADIEMKDAELFTPIGNSITNAFNAVFDGQGHTITGLRVDETANSGFFSILTGTVRNLHLRQAEIKGGEYAGGISGIINSNQTIVSACSFEGTIEGEHAGGITSLSLGTIVGCYSLATSITASGKGGIVEINHGKIDGCHWLTGGANQPTEAGHNSDGTIDNCRSLLSEAELYTNIRFVQLMNNALTTLTPAADYSWVPVCNAKPVLMNVPPVYTVMKKEIRTEADLRQFSADWAANRATALINWEDAPGSGIIRLVADINMGSELFTPIGAIGNAFTATFDGGGHTITGLKVDIGKKDRAGLFGYIGSAAIVRNVHLRQAEIKGWTQLGGIVGYNPGTIAACSFGGTITCASVGGGIAGLNHSSGTIVGCYSVATAIAGSQCGGIVGQNYSGGTITACHWLVDNGQPTHATENSTPTGCHSFTSANDFNGNAAGLVNLMNTAIEGKTTMHWRTVTGGYPELIKN